MNSKWFSRRWIITLWAMLMITGILVISTIIDTDQWSTLATTLVTIPIAFTSLETLNKKHKYNNKTEENLLDGEK